MKKFALVQLTPKDMRCQDSINLGLEIVKDIIDKSDWEIDLYKFGEIIEDMNQYDVIGFSIFYFTQMLNLVPFLKANNIEPLRKNRNKKPLLVAGGQGIQNPKPIKDFIDVFCMGNGEGVIEYLLDNYDDMDKLKENDYLLIPDIKEEFKFNNKDTVDSEPVIFGKNCMIELTRGCRNRCKFCQYGWTNGKYREKDIELVKQQILEVKDKGIKNINLLSCNLGGYKNIVELLDFCIENKVRLMNTDMRIDVYTEEVAERLDKLKVRTLKVGVESFNEQIRKDIHKNVSKKQLDEFIDRALKYNISNLHFYLIYGLPTENDYTEWFKYMKDISEKRKEIDRNIRIEFSITNFEPSIYTPYEHEKFVNFEDKHNFLREFLQVQEDCGYIKQKANTKDYKNTHGRLGRKERSYNIGMWLLHGDETIGKCLLQLDIKGIGRSVDMKVYDKIKKICDKDKTIYPIKELTDINENIW